MRQHVQPSRGPALRVLTAIVLAGAAALGCGDSSTQPEPAPTATFQFSGTVDGFPGLELSDARITITDADGAVVSTSTAPLTANAPAVQGPALVVGPASFSATLQVEGSGELTYQCEILDGSGLTLYEAASGTLQGGVDEAIALSAFDYVGPGVEVVSVQVDLGGTQTLRVGEEITAVASLLDGGGGQVQGVPVHWEVGTGDLELVESYAQGGHAYADFRATAPTATENIELTIPTGLAGSTSVAIVEPVLGDAVLDLTVPLFPGLNPSRVRVELHGDIARDTVVTLTPPQVAEPSEMDVQLAIPVDITFADDYTATVTVLRSETELYGAQDVAVTAGGSAVPVELAYLGPGTDATALEITLDEAEITVGQTTVATAAAKDAGGALITGVPIAWTLEDPGLAADMDEIRLGLVAITVEGGVEAGTFEIRATTPNGVEATATLTLVLPPGSGPTTIDFDTYPDGTATARGPLGTEYSELGIVFSYLPYSFSGGETTRKPHLEKSGDDGWLENGKRLNGSMVIGFFHFEYLTPVDAAELVIYPGVFGWTASENIIVLDGSGVVVTPSATITSTGSIHRVEYEGGIGKVVVETGNGLMRIFEVSHE